MSYGIKCLIIFTIIGSAYYLVGCDQAEEMRVVPQCPKDMSLLDCHYPRYKTLEDERNEAITH